MFVQVYSLAAHLLIKEALVANYTCRYSRICRYMSNLKGATNLKGNFWNVYAYKYVYAYVCRYIKARVFKTVK